MALESCNVFFAHPQAIYSGRNVLRYGHEARYSTTTLKRFCWRTPSQKERSFGAIPKSAEAIPGAGRSQRRVIWFSSETIPEHWKRLKREPAAPLWQFNTGQSFHASPMSYAVDGVQYVAIAAGSDVISFSLAPD